MRGTNENENLSSAQRYRDRVKLVREIPGLAAFWDFVLREDGERGSGRFRAHTASGDTNEYLLEPRNLSREFWQDGPPATMADFPLLGRGPFGQAVSFRDPENLNLLPVLVLPRAALHDSPLDAKGPGKSVSMMVWLAYQSGSHAIAGLWHEGTDSPPKSKPPAIQVRGQRQYGLFAGLSANPGAASAHVSENGLASFGDTYAHHLAVTPEVMSATTTETSSDKGQVWSSVGFVYDNGPKTVTAYINGVASEHWIENPAEDPFYTSTERAWRHARGGPISRDEIVVPADQFYAPPEHKPLGETILDQSPERCTVLRTFEFTKVRVVLAKDASGRFTVVESESLVGLKANPYYFGHDLYSPPDAAAGGPFTIGRVIHSNRESTFSAEIGGVAVYANALTADQMATLAQVGSPLTFADVIDATGA